MNPIPAWLSICWLAPLGTWWSMKMWLLPQPLSAPLGVFSKQALVTLITVQLLTICLFSAYWPTRSTSIVMSLAPAWPVLAILGLGAGASATNLAGSQFAAFAAGFAVVSGSRFAREKGTDAELTRLVVASIGVAAAMLTWVLRDYWTGWINP